MLFYDVTQLADLDEFVILDPVWLARIFTAVLQSSRDLVAIANNTGFVDRSQLHGALKAVANDNEDPDVASRDRRILVLLRHFGLCVPVEGTSLELFPSRLPLGDVYFDPDVWTPSVDQQQDRQVK